jgi:GNAT superfamily N-acetyltransferase
LLLSRSLTYDDCSTDLVRAKVFDDPLYTPRYTLGLRAGNRLVAAVAGILLERHDGQALTRQGYIKVLATDPTARRLGHATRLLDELETRFAAAGIQEVLVGAATPYYFWGGIDVRYSPALCLLEQRGYVRHDDFFNLGVDLAGRDFTTTAEEERLAAEGITIRRLAQHDRAMMDAYMQAYWSTVWHQEVMLSFKRTPIPCHIALQEGRVVGFAATDLARPGWFGPTGTNEDLRGKGIGGVLLKRCLADWQRAGRKYGEIAWIGPLYFYVTSCDARVSRVQWIMRKSMPAARRQANQELVNRVGRPDDAERPTMEG